MSEDRRGDPQALTALLEAINDRLLRLEDRLAQVEARLARHEAYFKALAGALSLLVPGVLAVLLRLLLAG